MISVREALDALFALVSPLDAEEVPLAEAAGRVLAREVRARRSQPPYPASAMDGYAVAGGVEPGARFEVIGEAAAGHGFTGTIGPGQAVRIFTGAPVPQGGTRVVIQEDAIRDGDRITLKDDLDTSAYIRPADTDFAEGTPMTAPRRLRPADIALLAAMNVATVPVTRRPEVAILPTGDELVQPGEDPGPDQIVASNSWGLHAALREAGARPRLLPIARDSVESLQTAYGLAAGADLIVTIGGASVGDHDLVATAAEGMGLERSFYRVAMRPGKPLMAGRMGDAVLIGLPGNPVSAMVCGAIFLRPVIDLMLGLGARAAARQPARLAASLPANGPREHYMRAATGAEGVTAFERQDSALLSVLAGADCLLVRPPHDPARGVGETVEIIPL